MKHPHSEPDVSPQLTFKNTKLFLLTLTLKPAFPTADMSDPPAAAPALNAALQWELWIHGTGAARETTRARRYVHAFPFQHTEAKGFGLTRMMVNDSSSAHKTKALCSVLKVKVELMVWRLFSSLRWAE